MLSLEEEPPPSCSCLCRWDQGKCTGMITRHFLLSMQNSSLIPQALSGQVTGVCSAAQWCLSNEKLCKDCSQNVNLDCVIQAVLTSTVLGPALTWML